MVKAIHKTIDFRSCQHSPPDGSEILIEPINAFDGSYLPYFNNTLGILSLINYLHRNLLVSRLVINQTMFFQLLPRAVAWQSVQMKLRAACPTVHLHTCMICAGQVDLVDPLGM